MEKITLTKEKETLLIPLYGKAKDYNKEKSILNDIKALSIINEIEYNFSDLKIAEKTNIMMCIRAKMIDDYVEKFLLDKSNVVALHLGCGLDSRYMRIGNDKVDWFDLDFEEVIDVRKRFYKETAKYHFISSSVTNKEWIKSIPKEKKHYIVIAEGLSMYLKDEDIQELFGRLKKQIKSFTLVMDAYSELTARSAKNHTSLKRTGAVIQWGIDDPKMLENWGPDIQFIEEQYFTKTENNHYLDFGTRLMFGIANLFPIAKKAHRLLIYKIGDIK